MDLTDQQNLSPQSQARDIGQSSGADTLESPHAEFCIIRRIPIQNDQGGSTQSTF